MNADETEDSYKVWACDNMVYGPIGLSTLIEWVRESRVQADTWVHSLARNDWTKAKKIEALRGYFAAAQETSLERQFAGAESVVPEELRHFAMFSGLSNHDLEQFIRFGTPHFAQANQLLIKKGDPGDALFYVLAGKLRVRLLVGLEDTTLGHIGAGEFFGEMAMFNRAARSADVIAQTETRMFRMTSQAFLLLSKEIPELAAPVLFAISAAMADRISHVDQLLQKEKASEFLWR